MNETPLKILFFGSGEFAVTPLKALLDDTQHFSIVGIVTQPDKPVGRRGKLHAAPVAEFARLRQLPVFQPKNLKDEAALAELEALAPDYLIVAAYGKILPARLLKLPRRLPLNLHGSLLPSYRGASPIQAAIADGAAETGVTLMAMDETMDHGPIIAAAKETIGRADTYGSLESRLSSLATRLLIDYLTTADAVKPQPREQAHAAATFTKILTRDDGFIAWERESAAAVERKLHAYEPWPGIFAIWRRPADGQPNGEALRIKLLEVRPAEEQPPAQSVPGTVYKTASGNPAVWTHGGGLELIRLQVQGKKPTRGATFLNGYQDFVGSVLASDLSDGAVSGAK